MSHHQLANRRPSIALACSLLVVGLLAPQAAAAPSSAPLTSGPAATANHVTAKKAKHKAIEKHVLVLVNKARRKAGLDKVKRSAKITKVARSWSVTQAEQGRLAHNPRYAQQIPSGWTRASENVARTSANASAKKLAKRIVRLWLDSPGHRANILGESFTKTGVGVARSKKHGWYFTQNFSN